MEREDRMDRRVFVKHATAAVALAGLGTQEGPGLAAELAAPVGSGVVGTVVAVHLPGAFAARGEQREAMVDRMVAAGLEKLTGAKGADAWRRFFKADDVVGLKTNCGARLCATRPEVAHVVAMGLISAGLTPANIVVWDRTEREVREAGYTIGTHAKGYRVQATDSAGFGYSEENHTFGDVSQHVTKIITEHCTALINLPVPKDHIITGTTGALKNHYGSIDQPRRCHGNHGDPFVADVASLKAIRDRERLVIGDALTVVYEGGPMGWSRQPAVTDTILVATDPVAHDRVNWQMIDDARVANGLRPLAQIGRGPTYLTTAAAAPHSLGLADLDAITLHKIELT